MTQETKQSLGGKKRAESLTGKQRKEIASKAAIARWAEDSNLPKAEYRGEIVIGDLHIPCAVLDNGKRVVSENGITNALLGSRSGASKRLKKASEAGGAHLPLFLAPGQLKPFISDELINGPLKQIVYKDGRKKVVGYGAEILPAVCDVWLKAREAGKLQTQQKQKALKAEVLMRGLAHIGVIALVDEATGYQDFRDREALQKILEEFIAKELQPWVKTFPDDYYENLFRLKGWNYKPLDTSRPGVVGKYTNNLIYERLAPGVLEELQKLNPKNKSGRRKHKLFQNLTPEKGHPKLKEHISNIIVLMKVNDDWRTFMGMADKALPKYMDGRQLRLFAPQNQDNGKIISGLKDVSNSQQKLSAD